MEAVAVHRRSPLFREGVELTDSRVDPGLGTLERFGIDVEVLATHQAAPSTSAAVPASA